MDSFSREQSSLDPVSYTHLDVYKRQNQDGERIEDKNINILHVMANESFAEFADTLQKEIENETGVKFGILQLDLFAGMVYEDKREIERTVTPEQAQQLVKTVETITSESERKPLVADLRRVLAENQVEFAAELASVLPKVQEVLEHSNPEEAVTVEALTDISYTETITEEKEVTYEDAQELMAHFEKKGYITGSGKMKDTCLLYTSQPLAPLYQQKDRGNQCGFVECCEKVF